MWSLALIAEGQDLAGAVVFTVLVTMKHLFACLGPLYAVYLLRHFCRYFPLLPFVQVFGRQLSWKSIIAWPLLSKKFLQRWSQHSTSISIVF